MNNEPAPPRSPASALLYPLLGPIVWAVHLAIVYAGHAVSCAKNVSGEPRAIIPVAVALVTFVALTVLIAAVSTARFRLNRSRDRAPSSTLFRIDAMIALAILSGVGVVFAGASVLIIGPCVAAR